MKVADDRIELRFESPVRGGDGNEVESVLPRSRLVVTLAGGVTRLEVEVAELCRPYQ
jgi:hypothetical protein